MESLTENQYYKSYFFLETDYASKFILRSESNAQRYHLFSRKNSDIFIILSDFLNTRAVVRMLTLLLRYFDEEKDSWQSLSCHIFTNKRDTRADYVAGKNLLWEELKKRNVPERRLVKVSLIPKI